MRIAGIVCTCAALLVLAVGIPARAAVPQRMNYQGVLLDAGGAPVTTLVSVKFTIYDDLSSGESKWTETRDVDPDADGCFSIILGEIWPIEDTVFNGPDRWLGIKVGADPEMTPRLRLTTVGYAQRVSTVDGSTGGTISGDVNIQSNLDVAGTVFADKFTDRASTSYYVDPGHTTRSAVLNGRVGIRGEPYWYGALPGTEWGPDLHINTGQDTAYLWLGGNLSETGDLMGCLDFVGHSNWLMPTGQRTYARITAEINSSGDFNTPHSGALLFFTATGQPPMDPTFAEQMRITHLGRVGIGTDNPAEKLDVAGTIKMTGFMLPTGAVNGYVLTSDGSGSGTWL